MSRLHATPGEVGKSSSQAMALSKCLSSRLWEQLWGKREGARVLDHCSRSYFLSTKGESRDCQRGSGALLTPKGAKVGSCATLHSFFLHAASRMQVLTHTGEAPVHLPLPSEASSGADNSAPHTPLLCPADDSAPAHFPPRIQKNLSMLPLESKFLLPLSRPFPVPITTELLSNHLL